MLTDFLNARCHTRFPGFLKVLPLLIFLLSIFNSVYSQTAFSGYESLFSNPKGYTLYHTENPLAIDGQLNESAWLATAWTEDFIDIEGTVKPSPAYRTRAKMLWDDKYLYIATEMEEPHLWANKQAEDDIIFRDNVFKIFIDPNNDMHDDFEIQINPDNLMRFLIMNKPYRESGSPVTGWVPIGLRSAVSLNGTLNDSSDEDAGWTAEIAIPLASLNFKPRDANRNKDLRINFMRTGWDFTVSDGVYSKKLDPSKKPLPPHYSVWTSQGLVNMHMPERWGYTVFASEAPQPDQQPYVIPLTEKQRQYLWLIYYKQKEWFKKNKRYAATLRELGIPEEHISINGKNNNLTLEATSGQFIASIHDGTAKPITINQDGYVK